MSEINLNELQNLGQRFDYIADVQVLIAAGVDPLEALEPEDRPKEFSQEQFEVSGEAADAFWNLGDDPSEMTRYYHAMDARITTAKYVSNLIGSVGGYRLGHFTEDEIWLFGSLEPNSPSTDMVLEMEILNPETRGVPLKNREISGALGKLGCVHCPLEVKESDIDALMTITSRMSDVLSRMNPVDLSISDLPLRS